MTAFPGWTLIEVAGQLLNRDEREAVLGDLMEAGETGPGAICEILGLAARRHLVLWKSWQPWVAAFGLALPGSLLLMGSSVGLSWSYTHFAGFLPLAIRTLSLLVWSWTAGVVVGSISRRTVWASIVCCSCPCLYCLTKFHETSLSKLCLLLFVAPAAWGLLHGISGTRTNAGVAAALAIAATAFMIPNFAQGWWHLNSLLIWPAWYMAAMSFREQQRRA